MSVRSTSRTAVCPSAAEASLAAWQADFAAAVCHPATGEAKAFRRRLARRADGAWARLDVYQHAYRARLVAALRDNVEVLAQALGDEPFEALATAYLDAHPPTQPSIRWFGHALADFMAGPGQPWVPHPALVDLARMEWALRAAFDAADAPVLDAAALREVAPEAWAGLRFGLHPSVQCLTLHWRVEPAWQALQAQLDAPAPTDGVHTLLVWRRGLRTQWRSLEDDEAAMLRGLMDGEDWSGLCALALTQCPDDTDIEGAAVAAASWMSQWLSDGLLSTLRR